MCGSGTGAQGLSSQAPKQQAENQSSIEPWDGTVFIVFSSVSLTKLKECGVEKTEVDSEGTEVSVVKMQNEVLWEHAPKNYTPNTSQADKKIFVDCSDALGDELFQASGEYDRNVAEGNRKSEFLLINDKLVFALRELRDFLYRLEKKGYSKGGTVKLCISAVNPVECLLFSFLRVFGIKVVEDDLTEEYLQKVFSNPIVMQNDAWFNKRKIKWNVDLVYCSTQRLSNLELKVLTPKGKRAKRVKQIKNLIEVLKEPTYRMERFWKDSDFGKKYISSYKKYEEALNDWKSKGGLVKTAYEGEMSVYIRMDYPAVMFEGYPRHLNNLYGLLSKANREEQQILREENSEEGLKKKKADLDKEIANQEKALKRKRDNDRQGRLKEIRKKKLALQRRNNRESSETDLEITSGVEMDQDQFWEERYTQDYGNIDDEKRNQSKQKIEFEGKMMTEEELDGEVKKINEDNNRRRKEIDKLKDASKKLEDAIDDLFWDRVLTGIQIGLAVVCLIAAPFAAPFAGLALGLAIGAAVVDAGIEVVKWGVIDDFKWNENSKNHLISIGLDVVSVGLIPLFRKLPQVARLAKTATLSEETVAATKAAERVALTAVTNAETAAKEARQFHNAAVITVEQSAQKAADLKDWKNALVMLNENMPSPEAAKALGQTQSQLDTTLRTVKENAKQLSVAEANMINREADAVIRKMAAEGAKADAMVAARTQGELIKEINEQSHHLFSNYNVFKRPCQNMNKATDLASKGTKTTFNGFFDGAAKFLGYGDIVEFNKAMADLKKVNQSFSVTKIGVAATGYALLNTGKHGWAIYNGFVYFNHDWVHPYEELTKNVNMKELSDNIDVGQALEDPQVQAN